MEVKLKKIFKALWIVVVMLWVCGTASQAVADVVLLSDDFNRPASNFVGGGWTEFEEPLAEVGISNNRLTFLEADDNTNRPLVKQSFGEVSSGKLVWNFQFDWMRTGSEGTYRLFMQLGDGDVMSEDNQDAGVAVNLIWTAIGGNHESFGYRDEFGDTALMTVSGVANVTVVADLDDQTYDIAVTASNGSVMRCQIDFRNSVNIDTVRFFTDSLNTGQFSGLSFDDVEISTMASGTSGNRIPVAQNQNVMTLQDIPVNISLTALDCDNGPLTYSIVDYPINGTLDLGVTPDDELLSYTPDPGYTGADSFTFTVDDGLAVSNTATVKIIVVGSEGVLSESVDFSESVDDVMVYWEKARYEDLNILGTALIDIPFGIALPYGYEPAGTTKYPLVLYLHGADARGDNNDALQRDTARFFTASAITNPGEWNAFVLTPQCAGGSRWVEWDWSDGPYDQTDTACNTYGEYMGLTENLFYYLIDNTNNADLLSILGMDADDIDQTRIYVLGDSMGAYGTWDIVARQYGFFAGAIAAGGSGPKNRLDELRQTPLWAIHGEDDSTVPNALPDGGDPDGEGSLGTLGLLDPSFDGMFSTDDIYVDDPLPFADDPPGTWNAFIYSEFLGMGHNPPASGWTQIPTPGVREWLFAQSLNPATCPGDFGGDGDVDGEDLAAYIMDSNGLSVADFAEDFGSEACP